MMFDNQVENNGPPWNLYPPLPFRSSHGYTYYDWETRNILEIYENYCINIFEKLPNWRCHFLNTNDTSYLISLNDTSPYPPCCIFGEPWSPPPPNFASNLPYNSTMKPCNSNTIDFYTVFDNDPINTFGYGFSRDITTM